MITRWRAMLNLAADEGSDSLRKLLETGEFAHPSPDADGVFRVPIGWVSIVMRLLEALHARGWSGRVGSVKEKLGELRFYAEGLDGELQRLVQEAEATSTRTCQVCGAAGTLASRAGRAATVCERHSVPDGGNSRG